MAEEKKSEEKNDLDLLEKFIKATGKKGRVEVPPYTINNLRRLTELIHKEKGYLEEKRRRLDPQKAEGEIERLQGFIDKYEEAVQKLLFNTVLRETDSDQASRTLKDAKGDEIPPMTLNQLEELYTLIRGEIRKLEEKIRKLAICAGNAELLKDAKPTEQYEFSYVPTLNPIPDDAKHCSLVYDYDHPNLAQKIRVFAKSPCVNLDIGRKKEIYKRGNIERRGTNDMYINLYPYPFCDNETGEVGESWDHQQRYTGDALQTDYKNVKHIPDKVYQWTVKTQRVFREHMYGQPPHFRDIEKTLIVVRFKVGIVIRNCLDCPEKVNPKNIDAKTAALRVSSEINELQKTISEYETTIRKLLL